MVLLVDAGRGGGVEDEDVFKYDALAGISVRVGAVPLRARVAALFGVVGKVGDLVCREHNMDAARRLTVHRRGIFGEVQTVVIAVGTVRGAGAVLRKKILQALAGRCHAVHGAEVRRVVLPEAAAALVDLDIVGVGVVYEHRVGKFQTLAALAAVGENGVIAERGAHKIAARAADGENVVQPVRIHEEEHVARDGLHLHLVDDVRLRKTALRDERAVVPVVVLHHDGDGARLAVVGVRLLTGQRVREHRLGRRGRRGFGRGRRLRRCGNGRGRRYLRRGRGGGFGGRAAARGQQQKRAGEQKRDRFGKFHRSAPRCSIIEIYDHRTHGAAVWFV